MQRQVVLVKFTGQYCPELHHFCAQRDHAPKLLGYGTMPGGWKVAVMEFVEHDRDQRARQALQHWVKWEQDLTRLVRDFHGQGLVHGNLRVANFIIPSKQPETIKLIDFDWAGEVGKVCFPSSRLNEELMDETRDSLLITKAHDTRVLNAALGRLKPVTDS
jgi:tRNA A-37 threonylcarbamoyl transferase component Bud32